MAACHSVKLWMASLQQLFLRNVEEHHPQYFSLQDPTLLVMVLYTGWRCSLAKHLCVLENWQVQYHSMPWANPKRDALAIGASPLLRPLLPCLLLQAMAPESGHQGVKRRQLQLGYKHKLLPVQACHPHLFVTPCVCSEMCMFAGHQKPSQGFSW